LLSACPSFLDASCATGFISLEIVNRFLKSDNDIQVVIVDVTECETECPQKEQKKHIQEKKRHTIKNQLVINGETGEIICVNEDKGSAHDMELFKKSALRFLKDTLLIGDKGWLSRSYFFLPREQPNTI
jgi:hypothetical protein